MTNAYATVAEMRAQYDSVTERQDAVAQLCLDAAAETIDRFCNWGVPLVADDTATVRTLTGNGKYHLRTLPNTGVTLVEYKSNPLAMAWTALTAAEWLAFRGEPRLPDYESKPHTGLLLTGSGLSLWPVSSRGLPTVRVTAKWGHADTVPAGIKEATIAQATRWFKRGQGAWGDSVGNAEVGIVMFKKSLDPDVQMLLVNGRYVRPSI